MEKVNAELMNLENVTGLPVAPDVYEGDEKKYITFTWADERPVEFGDDEPLADTAFMQVNLYTPASFNYLGFKRQIKKYLESIGEVSSVQSFVFKKNEIKVRETVFEVEITREREE